MFKQLSVAFLFCLTSIIANAQSNKYFETVKPVICDDAKLIVGSLMEKWGELPVWAAKDEKDESKYLLLVNPKTQTWTLLQFTPEIACILGVGGNSNLIGRDKSSI